MALLIIPTSTNASTYRQVTALDGRDYDLTFRWNQREDRWYLDIATNGTDLVHGVKIVANWPLLARHRTNDLVPQGRMMALDPTGSGVDPGLRDLGDRVMLMYEEAE